MTLSIAWSNAATRDLDDIWLAIAQDNPEAATKHIRALNTKAEALRDLPFMGRSRDELAPNLRSLVYERYLILYRVDTIAGKVAIVRVLHGSRDLGPLFT
ncbi:MAG: type II toxin-antitoxin system RelE/ParE family toxin [Pseudomonadota bacterium]